MNDLRAETMTGQELHYLVGSPSISVLPLAPFDPVACTFLTKLATELRSRNESGYPDVATFAFWCRTANLERMAAGLADGRSRLGLGLAFHITPSNVPINFAFSFAFGLLSGNANIVRVPSRSFPQVELVCDAIRTLLEDPEFNDLKCMTAFVRYEQDTEITARFSAMCAARIIWGGDAAIKGIRAIPIPERSTEVVFADRYSFCVINAAKVAELDSTGVDRLAQAFYNDAYLMDQNACSSPHLIVWQNSTSEGKERFWEAVADVVRRKYTLEPISAVDKYTQLCQDAIRLDAGTQFKRHGNAVYRVCLSNLSSDTDALRGKFGYFYEFDLQDLDGLKGTVNSKYQTLTYFGVDRNTLRDFVVKNRLTGIDRIVPVGQALEIDVIWDGYDIIRSLSRIVDVR